MNANRKRLIGKVVSDKMQKTIVVSIDRTNKHTLYKKYVSKSRTFKAHDEKREAKVGDTVEIMETRRLSKEKNWILSRIVERAV